MRRTRQVLFAALGATLSLAAAVAQADTAAGPQRVAVVRFALTPDAMPRVVRLSNYCAASLQRRETDAARRYCSAALGRMRALPPTARPQLEREAMAAIVSNAALMHYLAGEREQARALIEEAARVSPDAGFVRQNQALLTAAAPQRLARQ